MMALIRVNTGCNHCDREAKRFFEQLVGALPPIAKATALDMSERAVRGVVEDITEEDELGSEATLSTRVLN